MVRGKKEQEKVKPSRKDAGNIRMQRSAITNPDSRGARGTRDRSKGPARRHGEEWADARTVRARWRGLCLSLSRKGFRPAKQPRKRGGKGEDRA